jgi:aspartate aminotransferase-like enzyme
VFKGLKQVFKTSGTVVIYPSSGTGAWKAVLVHTLSPGDKVLMFETGFFATQWKNLAARLGLEVDFVPGDWRHGVDRQVVESKLAEDRLTAVLMPEGYDADAFRKLVLDKFSMSLGNGLGKLAGKGFRIGHLGDFNDLMLAGTLSGIEMGLALAKVPFSKGGVTEALDYLSTRP